jgi:hypothetical protein
MCAMRGEDHRGNNYGSKQSTKIFSNPRRGFIIFNLQLVLNKSIIFINSFTLYIYLKEYIELNNT